MRTIQIILILISSIAIAQTEKNLYITYNDSNLKNRAFASDGKSTIEVFQFSLKDMHPSENTLGFNKSGNLVINVSMTGKPDPVFRFVHENINGENPEIKLSKSEMKNVLQFSQIESLSDPENFYDTLNHFEKIYIIYLKNDKSKLLGKKVKFERLPGL